MQKNCSINCARNFVKKCAKFNRQRRGLSNLRTLQKISNSNQTRFTWLLPQPRNPQNWNVSNVGYNIKSMLQPKFDTFISSFLRIFLLKYTCIVSWYLKMTTSKFLTYEHCLPKVFLQILFMK